VPATAIIINCKFIYSTGSIYNTLHYVWYPMHGNAVNICFRWWWCKWYSTNNNCHWRVNLCEVG